MMFPKCEVNGCEEYAEHTVGLDGTACGVCSGHKGEARKISRMCVRELLEARIKIHDEFLDGVSNIKEKK